MNRLQFCKYGLCLLILVSVSRASQENEASKEEKALAALNEAEEFLINAQNIYPECEDDRFISNSSEDGETKSSLSYLELTRNKIKEVKELFPVCDKSKSLKLYEKPADCSEVLANGNTQDGTYTIWPKSRLTNGKPLKVNCDMQTEGGGWTIIQRRMNFTRHQEDFYQGWEQYKKGFGEIEFDYWLGNDNIHVLTNQAENEIRFDLYDVNEEHGFANYGTFWIDNEDSSYTLHISNYTGNVGDCMKHHNNMKFSTKDRGSTQSARLYKGGWWYSDWAHSNLNGRWLPGQNRIDSIHWWYWRSNRGLGEVEIKIRPRRQKNSE